MNSSVKSFLLLLAVCLARGYPTPDQSPVEQTRYPMMLTNTARTVQSVAHMAVVEVVEPLHTALYTLETAWFDFLEIAGERQIYIPPFDKPNVGIEEVLNCDAKTSPKYSAALKYVVDNERVVDAHVKKASAMAKGIRFVSQLTVNDKLTDEIMAVTTGKLSQFLVDYGNFLKGMKSMVCVDVEVDESRPNNVVSPMEVFSYYINGLPHVGRDTDSAHLVSKDTDSAHHIGKETDGAHLIGSDTDRAHHIGKETDRDHLIGSDTDSAHHIGKETDSAHLIGSDTDSTQHIGKETDSAHLIGSDTDSAHLIGSDTDSARLIGRRDTDSPHLIGLV